MTGEIQLCDLRNRLGLRDGLSGSGETRRLGGLLGCFCAWTILLGRIVALHGLIDPHSLLLPFPTFTSVILPGDLVATTPIKDGLLRNRACERIGDLGVERKVGVKRHCHIEQDAVSGGCGLP